MSTSKRLGASLWQCGPHVRIVASTDGRDGIDFFVVGAWFDNHYTLRRGQLFYNGVPCSVLGNPLGLRPRPRKLVPCDQIKNPTEKDFERCGDLSDEDDRKPH